MSKAYLTAKSGHSSCFICNRKGRRLVSIEANNISIGYAFRRFNIIIKAGSRCCPNHIDTRGHIKYEAFLQIKSLQSKELKTNDRIHLDTLVRLQSHATPPFDRFRNMDLIDDSFCQDITGWKKNKFLQFSNYITSLYDTKGRRKEELIAIYMYWLRKGLCQSSLSYLKSGSCQPAMSRYLTCIRKAIYKDFVPFFLGANSRSRESFISHNNNTSKVLGKLPPDHLAIVVDGTYTRIEKSSNNQVQYDSWSSQKSDLLVKPFTVCCTDGYFIDCYGPFKANLNDAKIFQYILQKDKDLLSILQPNKTTVYLDRGKNDFINKYLLMIKKLKRVS